MTVLMKNNFMKDLAKKLDIIAKRIGRFYLGDHILWCEKL